MHYKISRILVDDFLSQAVTSKQKAIIYKSLAISMPTIESLSYLAERKKRELETETKQVIQMNALRIAKQGLISNSIDKIELKTEFPEVYEKTRERKIEKDIQEKILENQQAQLFEFKAYPVNLSETTEKPMHEIEEEHYVNDLSELLNIEYVSKRVYSRDLKAAKQYGSKIKNCEICGIDNITFHIHPRLWPFQAVEAS